MRVLVTGGAGYIGSTLVATLLQRGGRVTVLDDLWFGGEALLPFMNFEGFNFVKRDLCADEPLAEVIADVDCVVHLAAVVGFPACEKAGDELVRRINVEGTRKVYEAATRAGVSRFIFASSYSNYGESKPDELVTEDSPLQPKSLYAESKIEAEQFLLSQTDPNQPAITCLRLATVFGVSPRMRFDLILNQFTLDAYVKRHLTLYQENHKRSFVHVRDVARAMICVLEAPLELVRNQVFNVGSEKLNTSKKELVEVIKAELPDLKVEYSDASFSGDMRSIHVSFEKIRKILQFETEIGLKQGIGELLCLLQQGIISDPLSDRFRNHPAILV